MKPLWLDFETFWSDDFTLRKMTPIEYVHDPRFEVLNCGFVLQDGTAVCVDGPDLPDFLARFDWNDIYAISHNALFDMLILSFKYGIKPRMYGCTLSMARNWLSHMTGKVSLAACAQFYGLPSKWETVAKTKGVSYAMLANMPELKQELAGYAIDDTQKCRTIFGNMLADGFPVRELSIIDLVVRMAAQPKFILDQTELAEHLTNVKREKQELLDRAELYENGNLMSDQKFAALLLWENVIPPTKISKKTGKEAFAFAKTDRAFTNLLEHPNPKVQALVAARLGHKSTLEETRTERLLSISRCAPFTPIPLKYSGAHTHRFSGDWDINMQNLGRKSKLRQALKAPPGHVVVSVDASQIEARLNATMAGQTDLMAAFASGEDVYASFAEEIYQQPVNKRDEPVKRFVGKTGILSLGYGSSAPVFQNMCRVQGGVSLTLSEATSIVYVYRQKYKRIVANWRYAEDLILPMIGGLNTEDVMVLNAIGYTAVDELRKWGPILVDKFSLLLPSGNRLRYRDLHKEYISGTGKHGWTYMRGKMPHHIYGAKVVENVIQALAFIHIMEVALAAAEQTDGLLWPSHQVHDELLFVVPESSAEMVRDLVVRKMSTPPVWMPLAPLAAEGHIGPSYGEAK